MSSVTTPFKLNDGAVHVVVVAYDSGVFSVVVNGNTLDAFTFDLNSIADRGLGYVGFTASTGGVSQDHYITSWSFDDYGQVCSLGFDTLACTSKYLAEKSVCSAYSSCAMCSTSPYPCTWSGSYASGTCAFTDSTLSISSKCPTPASYTWVWIVSLICIIIGTTVAIFYFWRKKQQGDKLSGSYQIAQ